jgi:anti-sigma-K factor RskA
VTGRGHERHRDDVGPYLLGALSELEGQAFGQHLARCTDCQAELERLRGASEALSGAVEPLSPSPELKDRLMRAVRAEQVDGPVPASAVHAERDHEPATLLAHERGDRPARARRARRGPRWLAAPRPAALVAGVALLAAGAVTGLGLARTLDSTGGTPTAVRPERSVAAEVDHLKAPGARADLVIPPRGGVPVLDVRGLPEPNGDRVYEVWLKRGERMVPGSLFDVSAGGNGTVGIPDGLDEVDALLVTEEPAGGRRTPTGRPILSVDL